MKFHKAMPILACVSILVLAMATSSTSTWAQQPPSTHDVLDEIVREVIDRTIEAAREEVRRNTGIDPLQRGYNPGRSYEPPPAGLSEESQRELRQLNAEHDRTIAKLEEELQDKLDKARSEFEREAAKEDKPEKLAEKRDKLREKVDESYAKFEENIADENSRYDEKRQAILSKERSS